MNNSVYIKNKTNRQWKLDDICIIVLLVFYILWKIPIVAYYMNTYAAMMALVLLTVLVAFYDSKYITKTPKLMIALLAFLILNICDQFFIGTVRLNEVVNIIWRIFLDVMPVFVGCLLVYNKMNFAIKVIVPTVIVTHIVTAITTYVGLLYFPEASRIMATGGTHFEKYYVYNIGGFSFIYSCVLLHPLFVGYFKLRGKYFWSALTTVIIAACVFESTYTTAALLFILSCIAYFLPSKIEGRIDKKRVFLITLFLLVVLLMLPMLLNALAEWDVLESSSEKLKDLAGMLQGKEAESQGTIARQNVYLKSWEWFKSSPIIGSGHSGGHSYFLDTLSKWGIIGIVIVIWFSFSFAKEYKKQSKGLSIYYYAMLFFVLVLILCVLNPKAWTYQLGFAAPLIIYSTVDLKSKLNDTEEK